MMDKLKKYSLSKIKDIDGNIKIKAELKNFTQSKIMSDFDTDTGPKVKPKEEKTPIEIIFLFLKLILIKLIISFFLYEKEKWKI